MNERLRDNLLSWCVNGTLWMWLRPEIYDLIIVISTLTLRRRNAKVRLSIYKEMVGCADRSGRTRDWPTEGANIIWEILEIPVSFENCKQQVPSFPQWPAHLVKDNAEGYWIWYLASEPFTEMNMGSAPESYQGKMKMFSMLPISTIRYISICVSAGQASIAWEKAYQERTQMWWKKGNQPGYVKTYANINHIGQIRCWRHRVCRNSRV